MADDVQVLDLKKLPAREERLLRAEDIGQASEGDVVAPTGAVMRLRNGDWCDKDYALAILHAEGQRALKKSRLEDNQEVAGAVSRERTLKDVHDLLVKDNWKALSRKLYGHDKATWFNLADVVHPEQAPTTEDTPPEDMELDWGQE